MLKRKLGLLVAATVMVGMFSSCVLNVKEDKEQTTPTNDTPAAQEVSIDYTNYPAGDFSIKVRNDSQKNVVCFKGTPSASTLISGAKGGQTTALKLDKALFSQSGDFVLWAIAEEDYKKNKDNYDEMKKAPFALIYAYYNADSDSNANMVYTISSKMGGESYILLNNPTNYNVELRQGGLYGESLAFAGANTVQTKVYVAFDNYYIYPVFRKFQKKTGEIVTCFPKVKGKDKPVFFQFDLSENGEKTAEFNANDWFDPNAFKDTSTPGAAYITITNGNKMTGISLYKGAASEAVVTSTGGKNINTGKTLVFEVPMVPTGGTTFASTAVVSGWKVGSAVERSDVPQLTVEAGKMYFLDVSGDDAYTFTPVWRKLNDEIVSNVVNFDED